VSGESSFLPGFEYNLPVARDGRPDPEETAVIMSKRNDSSGSQPGLPEDLRCFLVRKAGKHEISSAVESRPLYELPAGDVLIRVAYSSVNYKDAMGATGHPGVARKFPHVPGIDASGTIVRSSADGLNVGDSVLVTSYELGVERWGGWAEYIRVPSAWVVPLPDSLSPATSMMLGTAGLTAGLCVDALLCHSVTKETGPILVTGATGGVGSLAVMLLAKLGYEVVAVSGKTERADWLRDLGASKIITREEVMYESSRPLLTARWAGAVDTVGGGMLASLLRQIGNEGCVAVCGVVGGADLPTSVYPFILRGITLRGVDSAWCPMTLRRTIWDRLAGPWTLESLPTVCETVRLNELPGEVDRLLAGSHVGRTLVDVRR